ncbi:hypothetical protein ACHAW5_005297, partial [Stephanodiscus triporus]
CFSPAFRFTRPERSYRAERELVRIIQSNWVPHPDPDVHPACPKKLSSCSSPKYYNDITFVRLANRRRNPPPPLSPPFPLSLAPRACRFLPDAEYGVALDNLVKGCTDVLLLSPDGKRIFLGKRCVQPQPDWWFMGGRMLPGETPVDSCRRLLLRETGGLTDVDPSRFVAVCAQSFAFGMREQEPSDHGTCDVQLCYMLRLSDDEYEAGKVVVASVLDVNEYIDGGWKDIDGILSGNYHPALKYAVRCVLASMALEDMSNYCGGSDEELSRLTRVFLRRRKDVEEGMMGRTTTATATTTTTTTTNDYVLESKELDYRATVKSKYY